MKTSPARFFRTILVAAIFAGSPAWAGVADFVDPRIGSENGGNTFIGPALPFGMVKPGPDTGNNDQNSGWSPHGEINGFSQTHVSGTGGGCKYGNVLIQPTVGPVVDTRLGSPRSEESATLGEYRVKLERYGIQVELTAAERAAMYRFTYPESGEAHLVVDAGHCLSSYEGIAEGQKLTDSSVKILSPTEIEGSTSVTGGWNQQTNSYTVYFYLQTDTAATGFGTWAGGDMQPDGKAAGGADGSGAWFDYATRKDQQITARIGISFVSTAQAKANAQQAGDYERTRQAAIDAWEQALSGVKVSGGTPEQQKMFYTALYHTMLMPVDRTGENPLWKSSEPSYGDFYCIWDTFRTSNPLLTLIAPKRAADLVRSLVDIHRHEGFLPDGRSGNFNGRVQGGSNADMVIAEAFAKRLLGIDWEAAYAAVVQNAEVAPENHLAEGRGGLEDWHQLGYASIEGVPRSPGKTMEYAANDFAVGQLAEGLGKTVEAQKYFHRAANWQNLWDPDFVDGGFSGFIRSRHRNGDWKQEFTALDGCSWDGDTFYEGNSWTYSFFVPQDVAGLIEKCGGRETFVKRLDAFFADPARFHVSNEPFFLTPYLYLWAGRHDRTAERVHRIVTQNFSASPGGLPGNDDSGAMSAWFALSAMGIFPNAGQDVYLIGTPLFPRVSWTTANGREFVIEARNLSDSHIYITSATLNGKPLDQAWLRHRDLVDGGLLVLDMSDRPSAWPQGAPPPSPLSDQEEG